MAVKYVFVTGGVVSGLGKGITAASLGRLLKARGYRVTMQKFDPYINIDPGTMNPVQHGEVFVTDDGAETDLDLGHYERFIDESLTRDSNVTTGKIYWSVLQRERRGDYGGGTVQVIPHITDEIKSRFYRGAGDETRIAIIEVGGTVGDIESQPFLEAIRQFQHDVGHENAILIHVTLIPYIKASGELKTKPTQASVRELQGLGLRPDIIVCRSEQPLGQQLKDKISLFCNVPAAHVLQNLDVEYLYEAPLAMERERLAQAACECLGLPCPEPDLSGWEAMVDALRHPVSEVTIALVGKYIQLHDAYISVVEALKHGGIASRCVVHIRWVDSETVTDENAATLLSGADGVLVPGGFGDRGIEGKISAIRYARELSPDLLVVDSIQTIYSENIDSAASSVTQVRECAAALLRLAKESGIPVILIGHITKDGAIAGPKVLEHIVDVVLQFEGDTRHSHRILRSIKNRFGSTAEIAIFEMTGTGLREVDNPSEILTPMHQEALSGVAVGSMVDGSRPFLIEIQALVSTAAYGMPQRSATGYDVRRLNMLLAVLEKRAGFKLSAKDVFLNVAGGMRVSDTACDLAVVVSILSSNFDLPVSPGTCFAAEVGLSGEIRPVGRIEARISEAARLGYKEIYISSYNLSDDLRRSIPSSSIRIVEVPDIGALCRSLFKNGQ